MNRRKRLHVISILSILPLLLASVLRAGEPQTAKNDWNNLKQLVAGQEIQVVLNDAKSYQGRFELVSDEALTMRLAAGEQSFARPDILRVSAKGKSHRLRNALIGAGIGAGVGAALGPCYGEPFREVIPCGPKGAAILGGLMAILGAGVGAVVPTGGWHDVYRAASTPAIAPRSQPGRP